MLTTIKKRFAIAAGLLFAIQAGFALSLPENHAVNGGVTIVPIDIQQQPEAYFNGKRVTVVAGPKQNQWLMVIGIPLDNDKEIQEINLTKPMKTKVPFHISKKQYTTQYLTIQNKRKVDPYAKDRARIEEERTRLYKLFSRYSDRNPFSQSFTAPSYGRISSMFGLSRVFNSKPRNPHSGLDIASPSGTPVKAVDDGVVVETKNYFFTGNTIVIDHGRGVFSLYAHLSKIDVKKGDKIKQGKVIGNVGQTGRVTGPHLHWSMIMNGTLVDPLLFVPAHVITAKPVDRKKT